MQENYTELLTQELSFKTKYLNNVSEAEQVWDKALRIIRDNIDPSSFKVWFETILPKSISNETIVLEAPSQFFYEWLVEHYSNLLHITLQKVLNRDVEILFEIRPTERKTMIGTSVPVPVASNFTIPPTIEDGEHDPELGYDLMDSKLNPNYIFENFVVGESNQVAAAAAQAVADNPLKTRYNPLLIYANSGLGKTHLVHSIGNFILRKNPRMRILYTSGEQYYVNFVNAIQTNKISEFTKVYRNVDVLIIDDIQFFAGKEKTQDNFFHTFNALRHAGKLIILTSDKPTKELKGVDQRLISRFNSGVTVDIQMPDMETRMAILRKKARNDGYDFPQEIVEFVARTITDNIRDIEGAYISLIAHATFNNRPLTIELAKDVINNIYCIEEKELTMDSIISIVSNHYKLPADLLASKSRKHEVTLARQICMYLGKRLLDIPLKKIGSYFGGRDHSTVLHSISTIENYLVYDRVIKKSYDVIFSNIRKEHGLNIEL
jgi:chromosomal replication initiator protein